MRTLCVTLLSATLSLYATASSLSHDYHAGEVHVVQPWSRATPPTANVAGGYMMLDNRGTDPDRLVGGSSPIAARVEVHLMEMVDDVMTMRQLSDGLEVQAGEQVALEPGGYHLMLIGLDKPLVAGENIPVTLQFENGGFVEIELSVEAMGSSGNHDAHGDH